MKCYIGTLLCILILLESSLILATQRACLTKQGQNGVCSHRQVCQKRLQHVLKHRCLRSEVCCEANRRKFQVPEKVKPQVPEKAKPQNSPKTPESQSNDHKHRVERATSSASAVVTRVPVPLNNGTRPAVPVPASSTTSNATRIPYLRVKGCGVRRTLTDFIVGGKETDYWPWMAAIFFRPEGASRSRFQCGGTIISNRYILTAAHCLGTRGNTPALNRFSVRLGGRTNLGDGKAYKIGDIRVHEGYRSSRHYDDIALLKLSEDIESKSVLPVCVPTPSMHASNFYQRNGTIIGWGMETDGGPLSSVLREAVVPIVSNKRCDSKFKRLGAMSLPRGIIETQICAGTEEGNVDACQGDSGGPLLLQDKSAKWNVIGVVSFGFGCGDPEYPGVYTRVPKYLNWIKDNTDLPFKYVD